MAARHLWHYGYRPTIFYPKQPKNELYQVDDPVELLTSGAPSEAENGAAEAGKAAEEPWCTIHRQLRRISE